MRVIIFALRGAATPTVTGHFVAIGWETSAADVNRSTVVCKFDATSGMQIYCSIGQPLFDKLSRRVQFAAPSTLYVLSFTRDGGAQNGFFVEKYEESSGVLQGTQCIVPPTAPEKLFANDMLLLPNEALAFTTGVILGGGVFNASVYICPSSLAAPYEVSLPLISDEGSAGSLTLDEEGRILVAGSAGVYDPQTNTRQAVVWRLVLVGGQYGLDTSFGAAGMLALENGGQFPVFSTQVVYDGAFRFVVLARRLHPEQNNNDIVVYRRYTLDGRPDSSLDYNGEVVAATGLSEDLTSASVDASLRLVAAGSRNIIFNTSAQYRRDDSFLVRFRSQIGNCTLGGPSCACATGRRCDYTGFVLTVASTATRPARVEGVLEFASGVRVSSDGPVQAGGDPLLSAREALIIQSNVTLTVTVNGPGTYVLASSDTELTRTFSSIVVLADSDGECTGTVGAPVYTSTTLSVTVDACDAAGLSAGAIAGIAVGCVAAAVLIVVAAVFIAKAAVNRRTQTENQRLRSEKVEQDMQDLKSP